MNKTKEISDRKIENILNRCIILMNKGYDISYCSAKFKKHKKELEEYFRIIGKFKNSFPDDSDLNCQPDSDFVADTLDKIYKTQPEKRNAFTPEYQKRNYILRPVVLFTLIPVIFSFSFIGTIFASQNSVPNELLYKVKRTVEEVRIITYPGRNKGPLHFSLLINRLNETKKLINSNSDQKALVDKLFYEIEYEFNQSKKYNYFEKDKEEETLDSVNELKDEYFKKYGQVQENKEEVYSEESNENNGTQKDSSNDINNEVNDGGSQEDKTINESEAKEGVDSTDENTDENIVNSNDVKTDNDEDSSHIDSNQTDVSTSNDKDSEKKDNVEDSKESTITTEKSD